MDPFTDKLFYGALSFFLLDMGIVSAQRLHDLRRAGPFLIGFAVLAPWCMPASAWGWPVCWACRRGMRCC